MLGRFKFRNGQYLTLWYSPFTAAYVHYSINFYAVHQVSVHKFTVELYFPNEFIGAAVLPQFERSEN
jgi:hypothetical protein